MARDRSERRERRRTWDATQAERLRLHYIEQLPMVAALLVGEDNDVHDAVDEAMELIEACIDAVEGG